MLSIEDVDDEIRQLFDVSPHVWLDICCHPFRLQTLQLETHPHMTQCTEGRLSVALCISVSVLPLPEQPLVQLVVPFPVRF